MEKSETVILLRIPNSLRSLYSTEKGGKSCSCPKRGKTRASKPQLVLFFLVFSMTLK